MIILFPHHPAVGERGADTVRALAAAARAYPVTRIACTTPTAYEDAVRAAWGGDDLCIWEHDVVPTPAMLIDLAACPEPVCAQAYPLWWSPALVQRMLGILERFLPDCPPDRSGYPRMLAAYRRTRDLQRAACGAMPEPGTQRVPVIAHRVVEAAGRERWVRPEEPWADYAGLGLTRFRAGWMRAHPPTWEPGTWRDLDSRMSAWWHAGGQRVHVHWPAAAHHHACPCHPDPGDAALGEVATR